MDIKECQIYFWSQEEPDLYWSGGQHRLCNRVREVFVKIMKGAMVVARDTKFGTLYTTGGCMNIVVVAESASNSSLWHNRFGHMSMKEMKMLAAKEVLESLQYVDVGRCENYVISKQKQVNFTRTVRELKCGWK